MYLFPYFILSEFNITKKIKMIIIPISFQFSSRDKFSGADNFGCACDLHYVESGFQRGKRKKVSSDGYEFVKKVMFFPHFVVSKIA